MRYELSGSVMQTVGIDLAPVETVFSQTNCMCWMNDAIEMNTHTGGGFLAGSKRSFGGGSFFITDFTARGNGHVAFAPRFPGTILPVNLGAGQSLICRKETFLCAEKSVTLEISWQKKFGAGFFGAVFMATTTFFTSDMVERRFDFGDEARLRSFIFRSNLSCKTVAFGAIFRHRLCAFISRIKKPL